tara:strand:+ start:3049 stop:3888 length:840 start_codon:yes stop_codon:yes gene_type:complete
MINIVVTSKPVDGLLYYSYEYCDLLNKAGYPAQVVIVRHRNFSEEQYIEAIKTKYTTYENVFIDSYIDHIDESTLILGRSMMTLSWQSFNDYNEIQQETLKQLFGGKVISVYSENHPTLYPKALEFYKPQQVVDLCDTEVYPNGVGDHFEKRINFEIYKPHVDDIQFKYLFFGTNDKYYAAAEKALANFPDYGILTYDAKYVNINYNNVFVPVKNVLGIFDTYIYTKETFDPAPRIIQECKYFNKDMIYLRDKDIVDGGSVYWNRNIEKPDISPIVRAL